ncbi:MAG: hypothetical protein WCO66_01260 [Candidatus Absconditabacteria bacterium]
MPKAKKLLITLISIVGFGCLIQQTSAQFAGLPMSDMLSGYTQYSSIFYHFGGNNFGGMIFLSGVNTITGGENIYINGGTTSLNCSYKLDGLYFNNLRGQRLRPLDTGNLYNLRAKDTSYNTLSILGGLYTNCTGAGAQSNEIYGQITHKWGGIDYTITAGLSIDTTGNFIIQPGTYSGNIKIISGSIVGLVYDTYGGAGEVGPVQISSGGNVVVVGASQGSLAAQCESFKVTATSGTNISLSCSGKNTIDYILNLYESSGGKLIMTTNGGTTPYPWTISVPTGNYIASCTTNIGNNMCNQIAISNLSGEVFSSELGTGQTISTISMVNTIAPIRHADIKTTYTSEDIHISGLIGSTLAKISKGTLFINGSGVGTTGYVKNGDILQIKLLSSTGYNTTTSSALFIGGAFGTFSVITKDNSGIECSLNKTEKLKIAQVFEFMKGGYSSTPVKRTNMLYVLKSMTQDIQDFDYNCSLQYLMDLTDDEIQNGPTEDQTSHTAPNCKVYPIITDADTASYTSSKFKKKQLFASREALVKFIDSQNPGDCHVNVYTNETFDYQDTDTTHAAPNGKIYIIKESTDNLFSSPTMSVVKYFDTREGLINQIDKYNPEFPVRDHIVDTTRTPVTYAAANGKEYKIYKTNNGYMSYKLVNIKYFESKDAIIAYIDKNNK